MPMNTAMNTKTYITVSPSCVKMGVTYDEITTQKRHNVEPIPERSTIRNDENE